MSVLEIKCTLYTVGAGTLTSVNWEFYNKILQKTRRDTYIQLIFEISWSVVKEGGTKVVA